MQIIALLILLSISPLAIAHSLSEGHDALTGQLHVLMSLHHLPMLLLLALGVAVVFFMRTKIRDKRN